MELLPYQTYLLAFIDLKAKGLDRDEAFDAYCDSLPEGATIPLRVVLDAWREAFKEPDYEAAHNWEGSGD